MSLNLQGPRWSPDGEWMAVANVVSDQVVHTSLVRPDGTGFHELFPDPSTSTGVAVWTADGRWIACETWDPNDDSRAGVYMMKASDGSGLTKIAPSGIPGSFSPDGKRLVFTAWDNDKPRLALVDVDTTSLPRPSGSGFRMFGPAEVGAYPGFMPDGETIYAAVDGKMELFDLNGNLLKTISAPGGSVAEPRLSPDGTRFVFIYWDLSRDLNDDQDDSAIASMKVDGTDLQIISPIAGVEQVAPDLQPVTRP